MIRLDQDGKVYQIFYNNQVRSRVLKYDLEETQDYYKAMKLFEDLSMKFRIEQKLESGKIAIFFLAQHISNVTRLS